MRQSIFLLVLSLLFATTVLGQDGYRKMKAVGASFGLMGLHGYGAPAIELKFSRLSLRARPAYNSIGIGLEFEMAKVNLPDLYEGENGTSYFMLSTSALKQFHKPQFNNWATIESKTENSWSYLTLMGFKTYYNSRFAVAVKLGGMSGIKEWSYEDPFYGHVESELRYFIPYAELSVYGYPFVKIH